MSQPLAEADLTAPVIAIDGPSGSGKGTIAGRLAHELTWHLLDSGALYRIVACVGSQRGIAFDAQQELAQLAASLEISFKNAEVRVDGQDLTDEIRREEVSIGASQVAALPPVRAAVLGIQRGMRKPPGLIADGRDMGTVVFPDAPLKIFLDASAEVRAERRYNQLKNKGLGVSLRALLVTITERDERDRQRAVSPLKPADDAVLLDSTELGIEEVIDVIMAEVDSRKLRRS